MAHPRPNDPSLLVQDDSPCSAWSKAITNQFGVQTRTCKCGRGRIVKIDPRGQQSLYMPELDGEPIPPYFKLGEAKDAVDAVARGEVPPKPTKPASRRLEYERVDPERGAESYKRATAWFRNMTGQHQNEVTKVAEAFAVLGLDPTATDVEILREVRQLQLEHHPDRNPGNQEAADKFREISDAWEVLKNRTAPA